MYLTMCKRVVLCCVYVCKYRTAKNLKRGGGLCLNRNSFVEAVLIKVVFCLINYLIIWKLFI